MSLRARRVTELDALVFAAAGSPDVRSNAIVARRARQWSTTPAAVRDGLATGSGPTTAEAIRTLRAQGRRHIAVGSWFLSPWPPVQPTSRTCGRSRRRGGLDPMGAEPEIAEVALHRYVVAAMDLVDVDTPVEADDIELAPVRHLSSVG